MFSVDKINISLHLILCSTIYISSDVIAVISSKIAESSSLVVLQLLLTSLATRALHILLLNGCSACKLGVADTLTVHLIALRSESYCRITEFMDYVYSPGTPTELRLAVLNLMLREIVQKYIKWCADEKFSVCFLFQTLLNENIIERK